jgi:hypothetical protein
MRATSSLGNRHAEAHGTKEKINGYEAEELHRRNAHVQGQLLGCKDVPPLSGDPDPDEAAAKKHLRFSAKTMREYYDFPGLPIRTKIKFQDQPEVTYTITSVSQAPLPDSDFSAPPGYTKMELPVWRAGTPPPPKVTPANESKSPTPTATAYACRHSVICCRRSICGLSRRRIPFATTSAGRTKGSFRINLH